MTNRFLNDKFKVDDYSSNTPFLEAEIIEEWSNWDGVLTGVCRVNDQEFFFSDIVESVWRYYGEEDYQRLWRIYVVYDIDIEDAKKLIDSDDRKPRSKWQRDIESQCLVIGIFWR